MAAIFRTQCGNERRHPLRDEAVNFASRGKAGETRINEPKLREHRPLWIICRTRPRRPNHFVDLHIAGDMARSREKCRIMFRRGFGRVELGGDGRQIVKLPHLGLGSHRKSPRLPRKPHRPGKGENACSQPDPLFQIRCAESPACPPDRSSPPEKCQVDRESARSLWCERYEAAVQLRACRRSNPNQLTSFKRVYLDGPWNLNTCLAGMTQPRSGLRNSCVSCSSRVVIIHQSQSTGLLKGGSMFNSFSAIALSGCAPHRSMFRRFTVGRKIFRWPAHHRPDRFRRGLHRHLHSRQSAIPRLSTCRRQWAGWKLHFQREELSVHRLPRRRHDDAHQRPQDLLAETAWPVPTIHWKLLGPIHWHSPIRWPGTQRK